MKVVPFPPRDTWEELLARPAIAYRKLEADVQAILNTVAEEGDAAVKKYTRQFDGAAVEELQVSQKEIEEAEALLSPELKTAIRTAYANIERFHSEQRIEPVQVETMPGVNCWRKSVPIEKVGLYIPGGTAPLFSTVLMLGIPARIAGCKEIVLCSPPDKEGKLSPAILYTANLIGIEAIFKAGGVQAVGAMAYGTESIPKVYKIFGPGNQYVTAAKQLVSRQETAIDMPAGPSEVLVCADQTAVPAFVAADLLSQAEHGADSQVILVAFEEAFVEEVQEALKDQLADLPRKALAEKALQNSLSVIVKTREEAVELINVYAPEHLILAVENAEGLAEGIVNAGSVFLGNYTPESVGDYASGTNHTLPTNGFARTYSGVSVDSFVKQITYQRLSANGLALLGPTVEIMAEAENLIAHRRSVSIRLKQ